MGIKARNLPMRIATGAYVLHSGIGKWRGDAEQAEGVRATAMVAYPFLEQIPPERFLKLLAAAEIGTGALLLLPFVPNRLAGASLTALSGALLTMYLRTPKFHKPGSVWPTPAGIGISKDVWMLGAGLSLLVDDGD